MRSFRKKIESYIRIINIPYDSLDFSSINCDIFNFKHFDLFIITIFLNPLGFLTDLYLNRSIDNRVTNAT